MGLPAQQQLSSRPSSAQLAALDQRVLQKWTDFLGYLNLVGQAETDQSLRTYAQQAALALCASDSVLTWTGQPVSDLLASHWQQVANHAYATVPGSIHWSGFAPSSDGFSGQLQVGLSDPSSPSRSPQALRVTVLLSPVTKAFGQQLERVWEVKLGQMRPE
jgi:hypothetical protein